MLWTRSLRKICENYPLLLGLSFMELFTALHTAHGSHNTGCYQGVIHGGCISPWCYYKMKVANSCVYITEESKEPRLILKLLSTHTTRKQDLRATWTSQLLQHSDLMVIYHHVPIVVRAQCVTKNLITSWIKYPESFFIATRVQVTIGSIVY